MRAIGLAEEGQKRTEAGDRRFTGLETPQGQLMALCNILAHWHASASRAPTHWPESRDDCIDHRGRAAERLGSTEVTGGSLSLGSRHPGLFMGVASIGRIRLDLASIHRGSRCYR